MTKKITKIIGNCPIVEVSSLWTEASLEVIEEAMKKAKENNDFALLQLCKKRLKELQEELNA